MSSLKLKIASFKPGMELKFKGVPKPNIDRFSINVCDSKDNIALHFNPRFDYAGEKQVLVLDSRKDGRWKNPLKFKDFPFESGKEFEMTIAFADHKFWINLHDGHVLQFPNHLDNDQYDYIFIEGEVTIGSICVN